MTFKRSSKHKGGESEIEYCNNFKAIYTLEDEIKSGQFGVVYRAYRNDKPDKILAIKVMDRSDESAALYESSILAALQDVPSVAKLLDFKRDNLQIYLVEAMALGGQVIQKEIYSQSDALRLSKLILEITQNLHKHHVVHRNLKPENFLLPEANGDDSTAVLSNFDYAKILPEDGEGLSTFCGTPEYMAPEILEGQVYREKVDTWSIGCIIYLMLSAGELPFGDSLEDGMGVVYERVAEADYSFVGELWDNVSDDAKDLIKNLLELNPDKRWSAQQALDCKWFKTKGKTTKRRAKKLTPAEQLNAMVNDISKSPKTTFAEMYVLDDIIHEGSFGSVHNAHRKSNHDEKFAVKVMDRTTSEETAIAEISVLLELKDCPDVVNLLDLKLDDDNVYMIEALEEAGDLCSRLETKGGSYSEVETQKVMRSLLDILHHIHTKNVVHRNIKPENLTLKTKNDDTHFILRNFDRAKILPEDGEALSTFCGTPAYMAPEILDGEAYKEEVDVWSVGCIMYLILSGDLPFGDEEEDGLGIVYENIASGQHKGFKDEVWKSISTDAQTLVDELLKPNPKQRVSAANGLKDKWFQKSIVIPKIKKQPSAPSKKVKKSSVVKKKPSTEKMESLVGKMSKNIYEAFNKNYVLGDEIKAGSFGSICHAHLKSDPKQKFTVKVMDRDYEETAVIELSILVKLKKISTITKIVDCKMDVEKIYMIETGAETDAGDVSDRLAEKGSYKEFDARRLAKNLLDTLQTMHREKVVHRNLKPDNLKLKDSKDDVTFVLCNFDRAKMLPTNGEGLSTFCGTPEYMAPEILDGVAYFEHVDMWSVGCILFYVLSGELPFGEEEIDGIGVVYERVGLADYEFNNAAWVNVSEEGKKFIENCFKVQPKKRLTASLGLSSSWFSTSLSKEPKKQKSTSSSKTTSGGTVAKSSSSRVASIPSNKKSTLASSAASPRKRFSSYVKKTSATVNLESMMDEVSKSPQEPFDGTYVLDEVIKEGSFGSLYKSHHKSNAAEMFAVKVMSRADEDAASDEASILLDLKDVPNVIKLMDLKMDDEKIYMISDIAKGGDVSKRLAKKGTYSESDGKKLIKALLETLKHMHIYKVVHRNLKPENLLLKNKDDDITFVVCNFDRSKVLPDDGEGLSTFCGTPAYMAAEIVEGERYNEKVDMWSVGCITYLLLGGELPFGDEEQDGMSVLYESIALADYSFKGNQWNSISEEAKELIKNLLLVNATNRWSATQSLKSNWMTGGKISPAIAAPAPAAKKFGAKVSTAGAPKSFVPMPGAATKKPSWVKTKPSANTKPEPSATSVKKAKEPAATKRKSHKETIEETMMKLAKEISPDTKTFSSLYVLGEQLKEGSFGSIYDCHKKSNPKEQLSVKVIDRYSEEACVIETKVLQTLKSTVNVSKLLDLKIEEQKIYMIETKGKSNVYERLSEKKSYTEIDAHKLARVLIDTIQKVHKLKIVHRNLKLENLRLTKENDDTTFVLCNFDYARFIPEDCDGLITFCGTPAYMAPEILDGEPYREKVDMWSIGCILFFLLSGELPFGDQDDEGLAVLYERIAEADYGFDAESWSKVSNEGKEVVKKLLVVNPKERWSASQSMRSDWLLKTTPPPPPVKVTKKALKKTGGFKPMGGTITAPPPADKSKPAWAQSKLKKAPVKSAATAPGMKRESSATPAASSSGSDHPPNVVSIISSMNLPGYEIGDKIRAGAFGHTYKCRHVDRPRRILALKVIDKSNESKANIEANCLKALNGIEGAVQLVDFKNDDINFYLIQTLGKGRNIYGRLRRKGIYTEDGAKRVAYNLLDTMKHVHNHKVVHRDLKPENLVLRSNKKDTSFIVSNFEFAKILPEDGGLKTFCGTPAYTAPEILDGDEYVEKIDTWSVGCILFLLIGGDLPFGDPYEDGLSSVYERISESDYCFGEAWDNVSKFAKKLVTNLLRTKPKKRWTAEEALKCQWFDGMEPEVPDPISDIEDDAPKVPAKKIAVPKKGTAKAAGDAGSVTTASTMASAVDDDDDYDDDDDHGVVDEKACATVVAATKKKPKKKDKVSLVPFERTYVLGEIIKQGTYGDIHLTHTKLNPEEKFSVKVMDRHLEHDAMYETSLLRTLTDVPCVTPLLDFTMDDKKIYMVQSLANGGDVYDRLLEKTKYSEYDAHRFAKLLLECVKGMHNHKVVHRSLKPENLMLKEKGDDISFVIYNFDNAKVLIDDDGLTSFCGTPEYMAPEVLEGVPYREKVDMWSVGCILFFLLSGELPFGDHFDDGLSYLYEKIAAADYNFDSGAWDKVSENAKSLIDNLLKVSFRKRWSAAQALECPWIENEVEIIEDTDGDDLDDGAKELASGMAEEISKSSKKNFKDVYKLGAEISKGDFGALYKTTHASYPDQHLAVKVMKKSEEEKAKNETSILKALQQVPHVLQLVDFKVESDKLYVVQVVPEGGSVYDLFKKNGTFNEGNAQRLAKVLLETVRQMHILKVVHRDLKPENLMLRDEDDVSSVVLCNFDHAKSIPVYGGGLLTFCGTPPYMAPEILQGVSYFDEVDMWSIGCILFLLLGGDLPFGDKDSAAMKKSIAKAEYSFKGKTWDAVSFEAKRLIANFLKKDPKERWSASEGLQCSWITGGTIDSMIAEISKNPEVDFKKLYVLDESIKEGSFGTLYKGHHVSYPDQALAIKVMDHYNDEIAVSETSILRNLQDVPNVAQLVDFKKDQDNVYIIQSMATAGNVQDRLLKKKVYTERDARCLVKMLLQTIRRMHSKKIVHRNVKADNLILKNKNDDVSFMLGNFDWAKRLPDDDDSGLSTFCGTPAYMAPEVVEGDTYREKVDMWSVGCILFLLLGGELPFGDEESDGIYLVYERIPQADYNFQNETWKTVSKDAKTLIEKLLKVDPAERWSADECLRCKWIFHSDDTAPVDNKVAKKTKPIGSKPQGKRPSSKAKHDGKGLPKSKTGEAILDPAKDRRDVVNVSKAIAKSIDKAFKDVYKLEEEIKCGSYGTVFNTRHSGYKKTQLCVKRMDKSKEEVALNESDVLRALKGVLNVTQLLDFKTDEEYFYMVQTTYKGGDLLDRLNQKGTYTESHAQDFARRAFVTIGQVHRHKVVHRNLKPENFLLKYENDDIDFVLGNFEFAKVLPKDGGGLSTFCGTPAYTAPEIVDCVKYREKVDLWSLGCLLFLLLSGSLPFGDEEEHGHKALFERISACDYGFQGEFWKSVSEDAKDLIRNLITVDPSERYSSQQALRCEWIKSDTPKKSAKTSILKTKSMLRKTNVAEPKKSVGKERKPTFVDAKLVRGGTKEIRQKIGVKRQASSPKKRKTMRELKALAGAIAECSSDPFGDVYALGRKMKSGSKWAMYKATFNKLPNETLAVKIVDKSKEKKALHEVSILKILQNAPDVFHLIDHRVENDNIFLVQVISKEGLFFDRFAGRRTFKENDARSFAKVLLKAVYEVHKREVVHRNLRPENILFEYDPYNPSVMLCNFDVAKILPDDGSGLSTFCGSPAYAAPEVLNGIKYREKIDLWSVGCILYLMLGGRLPFGNEYYGQPEEEQQALYERISNGDYSFKGDVWYNVGGSAKGLIINLLKVNPRNRWTAMEALQCQWFTEGSTVKPNIKKSGTLTNIHSGRSSIYVPGAKAGAKTVVPSGGASSVKPTLKAKQAAFQVKKQYYTLKQIQDRSVPGLDYSTPEQYLNDEDFKNIFNASRETVAQWKGWKLTQYRRQHKLV